LKEYRQWSLSSNVDIVGSWGRGRECLERGGGEGGEGGKAAWWTGEEGGLKMTVLMLRNKKLGVREVELLRWRGEQKGHKPTIILSAAHAVR
jgi:hypothetical protein